MKIIKITKGYKDLILGRTVFADEIMEVDNARAETLINLQIAVPFSYEKTKKDFELPKNKTPRRRFGRFKDKNEVK